MTGNVTRSAPFFNRPNNPPQPYSSVNGQTCVSRIDKLLTHNLLRMENFGPEHPCPRPHPHDPLHGITLKHILEVLEKEMGWSRMAAAVPIRCFQFNPSVKSSLTFLRKTPWARSRVEELFLALPGPGRTPPNPR